MLRGFSLHFSCGFFPLVFFIDPGLAHWGLTDSVSPASSPQPHSGIVLFILSARGAGPSAEPSWGLSVSLFACCALTSGPQGPPTSHHCCNVNPWDLQTPLLQGPPLQVPHLWHTPQFLPRHFFSPLNPRKDLASSWKSCRLPFPMWQLSQWFLWAWGV